MTKLDVNEAPQFQAMLGMCSEGRFYFQLEFRDGTKFTSQSSYDTHQEAMEAFREFCKANAMEITEFRGRC